LSALEIKEDKVQRGV